MVEVLVASAFVAGGVMAAAKLGQPIRAGIDSRSGTMLFTEDLPCPWCRAATQEADTHCPNCHQPFG